ncbi:hypothetical protein [Bradyrhizobium sp.]|uniref:hypothetical protein n=1 Tax=Bradyrhizobium sp. TaxID=376 RepID=UPI0025C536C8|nr:hypothetical protein [Bradyrhizobium sp.]MBV8919896.1 hypothetical protein [Bradyrhizobium sp.]
MDEQCYRLIALRSASSATMAEHTARSRDVLAKAREVLKEADGSDTFLGRQHYQMVPLPHEDQRDLLPASLVDCSFAGLDHGGLDEPTRDAPPVARAARLSHS